MGLLYIDGFDYYSTVQIPTKYPGVTAAALTIESTGGRRSSGAMRMYYSGALSMPSIPLASTQSTLYFGFAFYNGYSSFIGGTASSPLCGFYTTGGDRQLMFVITSAGKIRAQRGATTLGSSTNVLAINQWYYIEVYATASATNGQVQVYVNDQLWLSLTGQNTLEQGGGNFGQIKFGGCNGTNVNDVKYDDLYVHNSSRLGDCRIDLIYPTGAGNYTQWTPSAGANWQCVDERPASDADYVYTSTVGNKDSYTFSDLASGGGTIYGVAAHMYAAKTSATARGIKPFVRISGVDYEGAEALLSTGSAFHSHIWENNPNTATTWLEAGVNGAEFGVKLTT